MKGIYFVVNVLNVATTLKVRSGRAFVLDRGFYGYVGSGRGELEQRVARHFSSDKKHFWHIDYLLDYARIEKVIWVETKNNDECLFAQSLAKGLVSIPGFGCSDCQCSSHLFFSDEEAPLESKAISVLQTYGDCHLIIPE